MRWPQVRQNPVELKFRFELHQAPIKIHENLVKITIWHGQFTFTLSAQKPREKIRTLKIIKRFLCDLAATCFIFFDSARVSLHGDDSEFVDPGKKLSIISFQSAVRPQDARSYVFVLQMQFEKLNRSTFLNQSGFSFENLRIIAKSQAGKSQGRDWLFIHMQFDTCMTLRDITIDKLTVGPQIVCK